MSTSISRTAFIVIFAYVVAASTPDPAFAYIGPGAGISAIGTVIAFFAAIVLTMIGFLFYPIKRLLRRYHRSQEAKRR